ncbi:MAG: hypothetical protein AB7N73_12160 [Gemmatimonadales bacterium]|jgi:DNA-directed RNA polymerase specialized sigma24 family protein
MRRYSRIRPMKGDLDLANGGDLVVPATVQMSDQERVEQLQRDRFKGPAYQELSDEMWAYALPVLKKKMRSGEIFSMLFDKNVMVPAPTFDERAVLHSSMEDRDALAVDTIAAAFPKFCATLDRGGWKPESGSSLRTFFVGACLFAFADVYEKWVAARRAHLRRIVDGDVEALASELIGMALDPERHVVTRDTVNSILRRSTPATRTICAMVMRDMTFCEIAKELGITERAVEGRMRRLRRRVNRMVEEGAIDQTVRAAKSNEASTEASVA